MEDLVGKSAEELAEIIKNERKSASDLIESLKTEVEAKQDLKAPAMVKIGGKTYIVTVNEFTLKTVKYTAEQLIENKELCEQLIERGSGILEEKVEKKTK